MKKTALITGINGQDGSFLAELLLKKDYKVIGIQRYKSSTENLNIKHILDNKDLVIDYCDLSDSSKIEKIISKTQPKEVYNLAAQSHVKVSFDIPEYTSNITGLGVLRILEAIKNTNRNIKFYQASSSEMFGKVQETPQKETTPFYPRSPYGVSKVFGFWITKNYRESYKMFAVNGILFNHESERRSETFITRKVIKGMVEILNGVKSKILIGNLNSKRDWGYAPEYVEGMWRMLQAKSPDDFILATNETNSIRDLVIETTNFLKMDVIFKGEGEQEKLIWNNRVILEIDPIYYRPSEVDLLVGDYSKAKRLLGWEPKVKLKELIKIMSLYEQKNFKKEVHNV
jgi:GDPmannose 4,6-dehydratase